MNKKIISTLICSTMMMQTAVLPVLAQDEPSAFTEFTDIQNPEVISSQDSDSFAPHADLADVFEGSEDSSDSLRFTPMDESDADSNVLLENGDTQIITQKKPAKDNVRLTAQFFPDANLRKAIGRELNIAEGSAVPKSVLENRITLNLVSSNITSLRGIEYFPNLQALDCTSNPIRSVDLSQNSEIRKLILENPTRKTNGISAMRIDLRDLPKLNYLRIYDLPLTGLDLSQNKELETLHLHHNNIKTLNLSNNTKLKDIECAWNPIETLDLSNNKELKTLQCSHNNLKQMHISDLPKLEKVYCAGNRIAALTVTNAPKLSVLLCTDNCLTSLDIRHLPELVTLFAGENDMKTLTITDCPKLEELECDNNKLTSIKFESAQNAPVQSELYYFDCSNNQLETLDFSKCIPWGLKMYAKGNPLKKINFGNVPSALKIKYADFKLDLPLDSSRSFDLGELFGLSKISDFTSQDASLSGTKLINPKKEKINVHMDLPFIDHSEEGKDPFHDYLNLDLQFDNFSTDRKIVTMHRLYNPNSGEHFYTASDKEKNYLVSIGWDYEGVGWLAPSTSETPVYRLYNPNAGDHHYTANHFEYKSLKKLGWIDEGIGWYSEDAFGIPLYRQYNPNAKAGSHNYTTDRNENHALSMMGWEKEGKAWYGIRE